ncbi:Rft-1-domain-containing protein [Pluteus cervinus]|uniref:Rft-1-domain-containing protein n=1 Tax=Pluteus cervinus TaxID=181527 RepID=A0ACD3AVH0_9AGAR|nr:Rft-1-domain-containing protein [Pluteus cervinus]
MPRAVYSGALPSKKKSELQEIANALRLSDQGTKDELQSRIKKHLDLNQSELEEDPAFAGLFSRRRRSVQPQSGPPSTRGAESDLKPSSKLANPVLDSIRESTPVSDLHDVSAFLKHTSSPLSAPVLQTPPGPNFTSSTPSPPKATLVSTPSIPQQEDAVHAHTLPNGNEMFFSLRQFLSNSRNIWSLTAVYELCYILVLVIHWKRLQFLDAFLVLYYPPLDTLQSYAFWLPLLHWAIPTLIIPAFVGNLISFNPASFSPRKSTQQLVSFDPLTASIMRLAAQVAYPYSSHASAVLDLDPLGFRLRVLNAGVGLAFAFSEQIAIIYACEPGFSTRVVPSLFHPRAMSTTVSNDSLSTSSVAAARSLVALQLFSRLFTFVLNQALLRLATPKVYGTAAIQFELMLGTILFLSREGVRNALMRAKTQTPSVTNISIIPAIIGAPLGLLIPCVYMSSARADAKEQPYFYTSVIIYAIAAFIELFCEPMHNKAMAELQTIIRVKAEGLGITIKAMVTFGILLYDRRNSGSSVALAAFAAGQLSYSITVLLVYVYHYGTSLLYLQRVGTGVLGLFDEQLLNLSFTMTSQSFVKHVLTEGDKLILSFLSPLQDQGGYAIAVNYGSLIARIVFQPIEETLRVYYARLIPENTKKGDAAHRSYLQMSQSLLSVLAIQTSLSLIIVTFGYVFLPIFLPIVLPPQFMNTSAPRVLSAWLWFIPVLAINGGMEAFLSSVASPRELNSQSRWMSLFSFLYIAVAIFLYNLGMGDVALVWANILNLVVRITYSAVFASRFFSSVSNSFAPSWSNALPDWRLYLAVVTCAVLLHWHDSLQGVMDIAQSEGRKAPLNRPVALHITLGIVLGSTCLSVWWVTVGSKVVRSFKTKSE